jgi:hypothetical protein
MSCYSLSPGFTLVEWVSHELMLQAKSHLVCRKVLAYFDPILQTCQKELFGKAVPVGFLDFGWSTWGGCSSSNFQCLLSLAMTLKLVETLTPNNFN